MKEFVIVKYPHDRIVSVDRIPLRHTNELMRVETGTHTFDLGRPLDYTPVAQILEVSDTTKDTPLIIVFVEEVARRARRKPVTRKRAGTAKRTSRRSAKKSGRKKTAVSSRKTAKKVTRKVTGKTTRKIAKKITRKVAKKTRKRVAKKTLKRAARKVVKRATKRGRRTD